MKKILAGLGIVLVLQSLFALCLVSSLQLLVLRNAPVGVTGPSLVVKAVTSKVSLQTLSYQDESAVLDAIGQGKLYGAYLPGLRSDTLIVVPAKSFFGRVELEAAFGDAAKKLHRPLTVKTVKPLPKSDRLGGVSGLLLIPLLIGGYLAAVLVLKATRTAAAPWHVAMLLGYSTVGAVLTDLIAGPGIGAYENSHFWPLLPCFILIAASVTLAAAAFQRLVGPLGTLLVATLFIIVGGSAGRQESGSSCCPSTGSTSAPSSRPSKPSPCCAASSTSTATTSPRRSSSSVCTRWPGASSSGFWAAGDPSGRSGGKLPPTGRTRPPRHPPGALSWPSWRLWPSPR